MRKGALEVEQLALWVMGTSKCSLKALKHSNPNEVRNAWLRPVSLASTKTDDAGPVPSHNRFSPSSASCPTTSCPTFTHLSQRPYPTCRIEHTPPLHLKNINAPLVTSRPESYQQVNASKGVRFQKRVEKCKQ